MFVKKLVVDYELWILLEKLFPSISYNPCFKTSQFIDFFRFSLEIIVYSIIESNFVLLVYLFFSLFKKVFTHLFLFVWYWFKIRLRIISTAWKL